MNELDRTSLSMNWTNLHCLMEILPKALCVYSKVRWIQGWEVQGEQLLTAEVRPPAIASIYTKSHTVQEVLDQNTGRLERF